MNNNSIRKPLPPFNLQDAILKVRLAEDAWNSQTPENIALAYTPKSVWRNRDTFINGREAIISFLQQKWQRELNYRLIKELWAFTENRIAVRFAYEWQNSQGNWFRSYGNENWQFDENGLMEIRFASINDLAISESDRKFLWPQGRRPDNYACLSELGL